MSRGESRSGCGSRSGGETAGALARISLAALRHNLGEARRLAGTRSLIGVVKADAYGHGALPVARELVAAGCERLAVLSLREAAVLRAGGVAAEILVLGGVDGIESAREARALSLTPVVHHPEHVGWLAAAAAGAAPLPVHVEVDTGMRRMGVPPGEALALLQRVAREPALELAGTFSHFARADERDPEPSLAQLVVFRRILEELRARGVEPGLVHVANSAGLAAGPRLAEALPEATAVRPGLLLYGVSPAPHLRLDLRPVMSLSATVTHVRRLRAGDSVGYAALYRATRPTRIATLPLGYADGVPVSASTRGRVLLRGRRMPFAGRVSMDYVCVDCGDEAVAIGERALLFGEADGACLPVEAAAEAAGTIPYELLVRVGARIPRVYSD